MFFGTFLTGSSSFFSGKSTYYSDRLHDFSVTIPKCCKDVYINSFFPRTAWLWNSVLIECFPFSIILVALSLKLKDIFWSRLCNTGLVSNGASLTSWGEVTSLALVGHPPSDGVTIKMTYGLDVLHRPASHPIFPIGLVKNESGFIVRSVVTGLGRWTLVVAVISVDTYSFLVFSDLTCHLEDTRIGVFWFHCATW